jgi:hypothetical protein
MKYEKDIRNKEKKEYRKKRSWKEPEEKRIKK